MADDFQNPPADQGLPADLDPNSAYSGNRPASGARRATPGEVLSQGFQGAQNAGDFLGLDMEFTASQDPNQAYGGSPLDLVPPPTTHTDDQDGLQQVAAPAPLPESDAVQDFAQAPSAFEFGEDLGTEEGELAFEGEKSSSKRPLLVGALLLAALGAGGYFYGPTLYKQYLGASTEVAEGPRAPAHPKNARPGETAPKTDAVPSQPVATSTPTVTTPPPGVEQPSTSAPSSSVTARRVPDAAPARSIDPAPEASSPFDDASQAPTETPRPAVASEPSQFPDLRGAAYSWATADQLELIWRGAEVPLDAVNAPAKTMMPKVGNVRVFTTTGDVFEGRLYAVGQGRVWIDAAPGRVGLDGAKVERIEVLPPLADGQQAAGANADLSLGGKQVRVRVPGGMLSGRVLKQDGEEVTLALADGGRVRVKTSDVQEVGSSRAIVVRR